MNNETQCSGVSTSEIFVVAIDIRRHGIVEPITIECEGEPSHRDLAHKLAERLA